MTLGRSPSIVSTTSNVGVIPVVVDYNISQITPYLFVAAEDAARQFPKIFSNGITCIINVANELPQIVFPPQSGIESLKYPIVDNPTFPVFHYFDTVADRIAANAASNRRTLLYCHHGRSRSITFTLAYLIKHHHLPLTTAFALVKEKRQLALPNVGFWTQLRLYELQQQQQRQQYASQILRNLQHSLTHGQQIIHKVSDGLERVFAQVPIVNMFTNTMHPMNRKFNLQPHYHIIRRKLPVYSHPYRGKLPPRVHHIPYY